jgi:hypothetical protein
MAQNFFARQMSRGSLVLRSKGAEMTLVERPGCSLAPLLLCSYAQATLSLSQTLTIFHCRVPVSRQSSKLSWAGVMTR